MALLTCILRPETSFTANAFERKSPVAITANIRPSRRVNGFEVGESSQGRHHPHHGISSRFQIARIFELIYILEGRQADRQSIPRSRLNNVASKCRPHAGYGGIGCTSSASTRRYYQWCQRNHLRICGQSIRLSAGLDRGEEKSCGRRGQLTQGKASVEWTP